MEEIEIALAMGTPPETLPTLMKAAAASQGLHIRLRGTLRSYPGSLHWHLARPGQPVPQYYFRRSLTDLLTPWFQSGVALDALEESTFDERATSSRALSWANFQDIPPVLAARLRLMR